MLFFLLRLLCYFLEKVGLILIFLCEMQKLTIFGRITGGGGAGRSKPAIKVNKVLVYLLINGLVRTQTLEPTPFG